MVIQLLVYEEIDFQRNIFKPFAEKRFSNAVFLIIEPSRGKINNVVSEQV